MEIALLQDAGMNITSNSTADKVEPDVTLRITVTILTALTIFLSVSLNPLMLFTLRHVTSIQPTTKIFMASLTLSDLCNALGLLPGLVELFAGSWLLGDFLCTVNGVTKHIFSGVSIFSLALLTVDRYIAISRPLRYLSLMTVFRAQIMVGSTWAVFSIACILSFGIYGNSVISLDGPYSLCLGKTYEWRAYSMVAIFVSLLVTIFILYGHITVIARNQARRIAAENRAGNGQGGQRINTRSTTTIIIITGTLIITWMPTVIRLATAPQRGFLTYKNYIVLMFTQAVLFSNGWLNIVIYYLRNQDLRQALRGLLLDWYHRVTSKH
ncbi:histamine H2 receptor-like [Acanthaster planci]|uniref:Histamine H2 receptor-like n=1 Tax=Acanthaster planci TaxID=133434 RepID=A0A8B7XVT5_ACAPL|nr:histamine H2 receptor-like [Acanthaster planci]